MKRVVFILGFFSFGLLGCGGLNAEPAGDTGEGEEVIQGAKDVAITAGSTAGQKAVVAVDAGFAGHGTTISIPTGFTASQCKFTAAAANVSGSALSTAVSINTTTGAVRCQRVVQERDEVPPETQDCVASYTVICVREMPQ